MMAFALYMILPPREYDDKGVVVQRLASSIRRSASSVTLKIWNIAAHDTNRLVKGHIGMQHGSKLDVQVWDSYEDGGDRYTEQCIGLLKEALLQNGNHLSPVANDQKSSLENTMLLLTGETPTGFERKTTVLQRINQSYFRNSLLQNYHGTCCVTGMTISALLVASHIKPWKASTPHEKTAATNGVLLNAFHDSAFDQGLITIDDDYRIVIAHNAVQHSETNDKWLYTFEGHHIEMPAANPPSHRFLAYHHKHIFLDCLA